jgi:hypothetical protein
MTRRQLVVAVLALTLARLTAYAAGQPSAAVADRAYVLGLAAAVLSTLVTAISRRTTPPGPTALDDAAQPDDEPNPRPVRLVALEDLAAFGADKAQGAHFHLRPYVRDLVAHRLRGRGIDLDTDPRVPGILGPVAWDLVRPDRPAPADGRRPGLDDASVRALTDALERL